MCFKNGTHVSKKTSKMHIQSRNSRRNFLKQNRNKSSEEPNELSSMGRSAAAAISDTEPAWLSLKLHTLWCLVSHFGGTGFTSLVSQIIDFSVFCSFLFLNYFPFLPCVFLHGCLFLISYICAVCGCVYRSSAM